MRKWTRWKNKAVPISNDSSKYHEWQITCSIYSLERRPLVTRRALEVDPLIGFSFNFVFHAIGQHYLICWQATGHYSVHHRDKIILEKDKYLNLRGYFRFYSLRYELTELYLIQIAKIQMWSLMNAVIVKHVNLICHGSFGLQPWSSFISCCHNQLGVEL